MRFPSPGEVDTTLAVADQQIREARDYLAKITVALTTGNGLKFDREGWAEVHDPALPPHITQKSAAWRYMCEIVHEAGWKIGILSSVGRSPLFVIKRR